MYAFTPQLLTVVKIGQQPKHLSVANCFTKSSYIHIMGYFAAYKDDDVELYLFIWKMSSV